ncbi:unnamed protein product, partial [Pylaiella littoralis]
MSCGNPRIEKRKNTQSHASATAPTQQDRQHTTHSTTRVVPPYTAQARAMVRLQRAKIRHQRYTRCMQIFLVALLAELSGEEEAFLLMATMGLHQYMLYEQLVAPTTLEGVYPHIEFFQEIGGLISGSSSGLKSHTSWSFFTSLTCRMPWKST